MVKQFDEQSNDDGDQCQEIQSSEETEENFSCLNNDRNDVQDEIQEIEVKKENLREPINSVIDFSFGIFWNWFLPSCLDVWSGDDSEMIIAYGAKSFLFLADVKLKKKSTSIKMDNGGDHQTRKVFKEWAFQYRDIVNAYGFRPKTNFLDAFRSNTCYLTTVVFDKTFSLIKHSFSSNQKFPKPKSAMVFLGNNNGVAALYDCHRQITLLQDLPFSSIQKSCCKQVTQKKILSAAWLHFNKQGPVVFYSLDTHLIVWKVKENKVKIFHDNKKSCSDSRFNSGQVQISCLSSLPAECTYDKIEHKLAIGYMGGKIVIIGLDPSDGHQTSLAVFSENSHNDDICSLSFSSYSFQSTHIYRQGLLCSVSRDSVIKVWSCSSQTEIAEHRIINAFASSSSNSKNRTLTNNKNWFTASFLPKPCVTPSHAYEIMFFNSTGDLLTFTLPEKNLSSKLRISRAQKSFQPQLRKNELFSHSFIVFSIASDLEKQVAITNSLDYKLILWDLSSRTSSAAFYSFSNGSLAIDVCLKDKRVAVAFGNSIFVLDFIQKTNVLDCDSPHVTEYEVHAQRLGLFSKTSKFYNIIWNRKDFERSGRLIAGTSNGEVYHYDLNTKSITFKSSKTKCLDSTKIYTIVWIDPVTSSIEENDNKSATSTETIVLTLHQSGQIMMNRLNSSQPQENFAQYLIGLPDTTQMKQTALAVSSNDSQQYLIIGNDDGTVDFFRRISETLNYRHLFRFRSFNRPCLSIDFCSNTHWFAVTALHESYINCYHTEELENEKCNEDESKFVVKLLENKRKLVAHEDRVASTCWSPFNKDPSEVLLVSGSYDTTCIIWNVNEQKILTRFFGHKSLVYTTRWCHFNENYIFSGGEDNFFFWDWKRQPHSCLSTKVCENRNEVSVNSLKSILKINDVVDENKSSVASINLESESIINSSELPKKTSENSAKSKIPSLKALFPLSNQIENNSSKYEMLDDIKWIIYLKKMLKKSSKETTDSEIPERKLDRVLLYGDRSHVESLLRLEIKHHENNENFDGQYILSLFLDTKECIKQAIQKNQCDPMMTILATGLSRQLWRDSVSNLIDSSGQSNRSMFSTKIKWSNYAKEMSALMRLCCLSDFQGAIDSLLSNKLFREAIILSHLNLASEEYVADLWYQWHRLKLQQGNHEGAIKCLIASNHPQEALELIKQRRTLCSDTSNANTLKQYDEVIQTLTDSLVNNDE